MSSCKRWIAALIAAVIMVSLAVPAWAADATAALSAAGISLGDTAQADAITRREVAKLLYEVSNLIAGETLETFYWAQ